jgi:hypothetical protein
MCPVLQDALKSDPSLFVERLGGPRMGAAAGAQAPPLGGGGSGGAPAPAPALAPAPGACQQLTSSSPAGGSSPRGGTPGSSAPELRGSSGNASAAAPAGAGAARSSRGSRRG